MPTERVSKIKSLETWASRWIAFPIIFLGSKKKRMECSQDLQEVIYEMYQKDYPEWMINIVCILKTLGWVLSAMLQMIPKMIMTVFEKLIK